ncbi:hypothetical protein GQ464_002275 [Rhodocaloribacter litoris]|uniref:hypothetical protein n=1 Tax=Rhodocaloribacter litoris TaxID=2558931 RepID=UPI0014238A57|nr:hypothetical protein [Rhodocaloribacter litoris]QXD15796.1 hypothetical protein GQ464_002275 [Rhodocaloribacter litoris]
MHLIETAYRWIRHTRAAGCRFDAETKAAQAVAFVLDRGGHTFALPSKLDGVSRHQDVLDAIRQAGMPFQPLDLHREGDRIAALWHGVPVGFIRPKHVRWLRPLLETGHVRCFVLQVTDSGHRFKGCNVVLTGIGRALDALEALPQPVVQEPVFAYRAVA